MNGMKRLFTNFTSNISALFKPKMLRWQALAIVLTALFVWSGLDWWYFLQVRNPLLNQLFFPALVVGMLLPIPLALVLLLIGHVRKQPRLITMAWALGQSMLIGWTLSICYKAVTGRLQPNTYNLVTDISNGFRFGFLEGGVFWGWPSSHTTVAFSMAVTLFILYPKNTFVRFAVLIYAFYIGIGVSLGIHWLSEFIAGAIFGSIVGVVVGRSFLKQSEK